MGKHWFPVKVERKKKEKEKNKKQKFLYWKQMGHINYTFRTQNQANLSCTETTLFSQVPPRTSRAGWHLTLCSLALFLFVLVCQILDLLRWSGREEGMADLGFVKLICWLDFLGHNIMQTKCLVRKGLVNVSEVLSRWLSVGGAADYWSTPTPTPPTPPFVNILLQFLLGQG